MPSPTVVIQSAKFSDVTLVLKSKGLFVVEVGEIEGFARSIGSHGPKWVNSVLSKDLAGDAELEDARQFVSSVVA
jgi:hypothetical protein